MDRTINALGDYSHLGSISIENSTDFPFSTKLNVQDFSHTAPKNTVPREVSSSSSEWSSFSDVPL